MAGADPGRAVDVMEVMERLREVWSSLRSMVTRGKLVMSGYDPTGRRTMLQGNGLEGETHQGIELLLPYGMSAIPVGSTPDYLLFQVQGMRDHKVAIGADDPSLRIPDLAAGELGFRNGRGSQVVFRNNKIEITAPLDDIVATAAQGNVSVAATNGQVNISSKGNTSLAVSDGALTVNASGAITLTGAVGQIKANGNVLG